MKTRLFTMLACAGLLITCRPDEPGELRGLKSETRTYAIGGFKRLEVSDAFDVVILQSAKFSVAVSGDRENLNNLVVTKEGDILHIHFADSKNRVSTTHVTVAMPSVEGVAFSGAVTGAISGFKPAMPFFDMLLGGSSTCQLEVNSKTFQIQLTGSASAVLAGGGGMRLQASLSGASRLDASRFIFDAADMDLSGSSVANVHVTSSLQLHTDGASAITNTGSAETEGN